MSDEGAKRAIEMADQLQKDIREVEAQSRCELIAKAVLETAQNIVKETMEKNAEKINENLFKWVDEVVQREITKHGSVADIVRAETRKFLEENYEKYGTPFLDALEEGEREGGFVDKKGK